MKSIIVSMVAAVGLMAAGSVLAADMPDIAKKNNCTACHAIDKKVVGPAWMDVSKKYKGDATQKARLVTKIMKGGGGVWGAMPMPANPKLTEAEAGTLVDFVLGLAK
ncbi:MAG TPA: c-type cytochrome [Gallionella sp.]|nr:c-type cytochrome [Gallionella sp.]